MTTARRMASRPPPSNTLKPPRLHPAHVPAADTQPVHVEPKRKRATLEQPTRAHGPVLDSPSRDGAATLVLHAAQRGSPVKSTELFPFMGSHRPDVRRFTEHLAGTYGHPGGADQLADDLIRTSMANVLADPQRVPPNRRGDIEQAVHAYLAPALLGFATARVANHGHPFSQTLVKHTVTQEPVFRTWGEAEAIAKRTARELGIDALRAKQREEGEALTAGLRLPDADPRKAAAVAAYYESSARTNAAVEPILKAAKRAGYGELAGRVGTPGNPHEEDKVGQVESGHTSTVVMTDEFRRTFNALIAHEQHDPKGFAATLQKVTVDPTAFLAVLLGEHVYPDGAAGRLVRAARPKLVDRADDSVLARLGDVYGAMKSSAEQQPLLSADGRTYDLPSSLTVFLAKRAQLAPEFLSDLGYAGTTQLDFNGPR